MQRIISRLAPAAVLLLAGCLLSSCIIVAKAESHHPKGYGFVGVESTPAAELYVDGDFVGTTPAKNLKLSSGPHDIRLEAEGYETWSRTVKVFPEQQVQLKAVLEED